MSYIKLCELVLIVLTHVQWEHCTSDFITINNKYHLVTESYNMAKELFIQGRDNYEQLKRRSLKAIDTFLDLVLIMNSEMAKDMRSSIIRFHKIKYFKDFGNVVLSIEEVVDIVEHCLVEPIEKDKEFRTQFREVIRNFEDVRNFDVVNKCSNNLPDEVAAAHCILHQAMLFNETMQESLITIVEIKTRQFAYDINATLYNVKNCFNNFVPHFFEQTLLQTYTAESGHMKIVNASVSDIMKDRWRNSDSKFTLKWEPVVKLFQNSVLPSQTHLEKSPLFLTLFNANISVEDIIQTLYH